MHLMHTTPTYEGSPAAAPSSPCGELFGWLFGFVTVPTPAYETAAPTTPTTTGNGVVERPQTQEGTCPPSIIAPAGPVTIVLGTGPDYRTE